MHCMVDIETLGKQPGCVVLQVAAVLFDPEAAPDSLTAENSSGLTCNLDWQDQADRRGLRIEPETLKWWLQCGNLPQLLNAVPKLTATQMWHNLHLLAAGKSTVQPHQPVTHWWARGKDFDFPILAAHHAACKNLDDYTGLRWPATLPWSYSQTHEVRTLLDFVGLKASYATVAKHTALGDCLAQIADVQRAYAIRRGWRNTNEQLKPSL